LLGSYTIRSYDGPSVIERYDALLAERKAVAAQIGEMNQGYNSRASNSGDFE
jgi:hypothetical protein